MSVERKTGGDRKQAGRLDARKRIIPVSEEELEARTDDAELLKLVVGLKPIKASWPEIDGSD